MASNCTDCKHYEWDFEDSDGHIIGGFNTCNARHGVGNLKQFPFKKTTCDKFTDKEAE